MDITVITCIRAIIVSDLDRLTSRVYIISIIRKI